MSKKFQKAVIILIVAVLISSLILPFLPMFNV